MLPSVVVVVHALRPLSLCRGSLAMTMLIDARHNVTQPEGRYKTDPSAIIGIAVHHTVTFYPAPAADVAIERAHIQMIDQYHVSQGWGGFGYHTITFPSGRTYLCGDLDGARAHVASRNGELIGCAFAGDHTNVAPTADAIAGASGAVAAARAYVSEAVARGGAPRPARPPTTLAPVPHPSNPSVAAVSLPIAGHRSWALPAWPTSCPGDALSTRLGTLEREEPVTDDKTLATVRFLLGPGDNWVVASVLRAQATAYRAAAQALDDAAAVQEAQADSERAVAPWPGLS